MSWKYQPHTQMLWVVSVRSGVLVPKKMAKKDIIIYNKRNPAEPIEHFEKIEDCQTECDKLNLV